MNFDTVNGANNAEFTGAGRSAFNGAVNVNEAVTLNMVGGTVDLDGRRRRRLHQHRRAADDQCGDDGELRQDERRRRHNTLDINNSVGTGVLTVNLDNADAEWTLNAPGVMNLVNDNTEATLLAGSDVNLNGTVNVTGDVRDRRPRSISAGRREHQHGGSAAAARRRRRLDRPQYDRRRHDQRRRACSAPMPARHCTASARSTRASTSTARPNLLADDGTLTINGAIVDVGQLGTADADGMLNVTNAWNTNVRRRASR